LLFSACFLRGGKPRVMEKTGQLGFQLCHNTVRCLNSRRANYLNFVTGARFWGGLISHGGTRRDSATSEFCSVCGVLTAGQPTWGGGGEKSKQRVVATQFESLCWRKGGLVSTNKVEKDTFPGRGGRKRWGNIKKWGKTH